MATFNDIKSKSIGTSDEFTKEELEFLLQIISNSTFEGRDVQIVYETAVKVQKKILNLK